MTSPNGPWRSAAGAVPPRRVWGHVRTLQRLLRVHVVQPPHARPTLAKALIPRYNRNPVPPARGTMNARVVIPILAAACVSLLNCDRVPSDLRNPGRPSFITDGALDGNAHPAVVLIIMDIAGKPAFRCSGTIIAPKLVLTAGHCAGEPGEFSGLRIFNEADVQHDPTYPFGGGPNTIEATAWHAHPLFTERAFFLHDVGVVLLSKAVKLSAGQYGKLPTQDQLDALKPSSSTVFTAVGYGLQEINPV